MSSSNNDRSASNFIDIEQLQDLSKKQISSEPKKSQKSSLKQVKPHPFRIRKKTTVGFERAEWEAAVKNTKQISVRYQNGEKIPFNTELDKFRIYGPGIYLFFTFFRTVFLVFVLIGIISIIPIVYNGVVGQQYDNMTNTFSKYISKLTIGNLQPEGQRNSSLTDKLLNALPSFFISVIFFVFYLYWRKRSTEQIQRVQSTVKMLSYKVVQVYKFPSDVTQQQVSVFMSQFGEVKEIAVVRNYKEVIYYCRRIYQKTLDGKQLVLEQEKRQLQNDEKFNKQIQQKEKQLQQLYNRLSEEERNASQQIIKFYVTFQSPQERQKAVEAYSLLDSTICPCFKTKLPEELTIRGQPVYIRACHTQPAGIIWENMHITWKTRWIRLSLQLLLIVVLIFLGFCFVLFLNVLSPPNTISTVDSSSYNQTTIVEVKDKAIIRSWCLDNTEKVKANPETDYGTLCQNYIKQSFGRVMISIAIACGILLIKYALKYTVIYLSKFMRYKTYAEEVLEMTKNLFLTYVFTAIFITLLMQARFDNFIPKKLIRYLTNDSALLQNQEEIAAFKDTNSGWYLNVGYQIWLTWLILALSYPLLILTYHYPLKRLRRYLAGKQVLQKKMENYLQPEEFEIYDHYADAALLIFVGMVFSPGMPSLLVLTCVGLGLRYLYYKFIFIKFSKIPKPLDQSLNSLIMGYLVVTLFFHLIMAMWMYGVDDLFAHEDSFLKSKLYNENDSNFTKFWMTFFKRCIDSWYLTALLVFYCFYFFLAGFLKTIYQKLTGSQKIYKAPQNMLKATIGNGGYMSGLASQRTLTKSYRIQNNPSYFDILAVMQRRELACTIQPSRLYKA